MDYQCGIINECLHLLKQSSMPTRKRLRLEIQLIGIKKLLVYDRGLSKNIEHWPNGQLKRFNDVFIPYFEV